MLRRVTRGNRHQSLILLLLIVVGCTKERVPDSKGTEAQVEVSSSFEGGDDDGEKIIIRHLTVNYQGTPMQGVEVVVYDSNFCEMQISDVNGEVQIEVPNQGGYYLELYNNGVFIVGQSIVISDTLTLLMHVI